MLPNKNLYIQVHHFKHYQKVARRTDYTSKQQWCIQHIPEL